MNDSTPAPQVALKNPPAARAGRPTKEQAEARQAQLLETALDMFLDQGFEKTTIEDIAAAVSMTKRTIYARYEGKDALFLAAVRRAIDLGIVETDRLTALDNGNLADTLKAVAHLRVGNVQTPSGLRLQRIIATESYRFPEIFNEAFDRGTQQVIAFLVKLFTTHPEAGPSISQEPELAARAFMSMVVGGPVRIIVSGNKMGRTEIERWIDFAVRLFLEGARPRTE